MVDARRWILVEAWLALGLRIEWCPSYRAREVTGWQECEETRQSFVYAGSGTWQVLEPAEGYRRFPRPDCPSLGTETMRHELAHYLAATATDRAAINFALNDTTDEAERRCLEVEKVIDALLGGANRIAAMALGGAR